MISEVTTKLKVLGFRKYAARVCVCVCVCVCVGGGVLWIWILC